MGDGGWGMGGGGGQEREEGISGRGGSLATISSDPS